VRSRCGHAGDWTQKTHDSPRHSALQLHPNEPALYVFAAQHELENLSPAAARALLQRGIRLNKENVALWTEYVKFELGFVEGLRRRWDVLGLGSEEGGAAAGGEDASEEARREIMQGGIVKAVISEAAKGALRVMPPIRRSCATQRSRSSPSSARCTRS